MRDITNVALASGPLVLIAYLAGTLSYTYSNRDDDDRARFVIEAVATAASTTLAWYTVKQLSPGSSFSRVALQSNQVLIVWESVALWCGLAAVVGHIAPFTNRFRGTSGLVAAMTVAALYAPLLFVAALGGFSVGVLSTGGRPRPAVPVGLGAALAVSWVAWVFEWNVGWGVATGPELTLWTMVTTATLLARWLNPPTPH